MLSSEFVAAEISISEMAPENALRLCRPFAKVTSTIHKHLVYSPQFFAEAENCDRAPSALTSILSPTVERGGSSYGLLDWDVDHSTARIIQTRKKRIKGERAKTQIE